MDHSDGQMDIFEVLEDVRINGLTDASGKEVGITPVSDDELAEIVMRGVHLTPLWFRPSSPRQ